MTETVRLTLIICAAVLLAVLGGMQACVEVNRSFTEHGYCEGTRAGSAQTVWVKCAPLETPTHDGR